MPYTHTHTNNDRGHKIFRWKSLIGKNHGSPQTEKYHYMREVTSMKI